MRAALRCSFRVPRRLGGTPSCRMFSTTEGGILLLCDHDNKSVGSSTLNAVTAAAKLPGDLTLLVCGENCESVAQEAAKIKGVSKVIHSDHAAFGHGLSENVTELVVELQKANGFEYVLAPSNTYGKDILPRAAANLDVQPISEVIEIKTPDTFVRPVYAGNALATMQSTDSIKLLTIRSTAFEAAELGGDAVSIETFTPAKPDAGMTTWVKDELSKSERPELGSASVVISGGRALKSAENFQMLYDLADDLKGAVGASRAAVDAGYAPNDMQVGQTGKVVAPDLYIAVGISGAIQHLAGMKDSKTIVAINKDEDAPIFQVADYGLVGDLFEEVPKLREKISN
ncbi:hypothetical protein AAMO2058_001297100 [Amorphochlora amoebiformis]